MLPSIYCSLSCGPVVTTPDWPDNPPASLLLQLFLTKYTPFMVFPADAPPGATLAVATNVLIKVLRSRTNSNATQVAAASCLTQLAGEGPARTSPVLPACCLQVWQVPASSTGRQSRFGLAGAGLPAVCSQGLATACSQHRQAAQLLAGRHWPISGLLPVLQQSRPPAQSVQAGWDVAAFLA